MKIVLEKSDCIDDWYSIVRAEHDGREWWEKIDKTSSRLRMSKRISDACVEGTSREMMEIARAIKNNQDAHFKRCAVKFSDDGVHFWSPRNSEQDAVIPVEDANEFADSVLKELL